MNLYPLSVIQKDDLLQLICSFYPQSGQLAFYITLGEEVLPETMEKAVNIEIERNDSLRLRFKRKGLKTYQYFLPEYKLENIPFDDFRVKTEEDMIKSLKSDACVALKYFKGETFRIRFFVTPEGRFGVYLCIMHLSMDISAILHFFKDLINVYVSVKNKTELPAPICTFEEGLKRDLEIFSNKQRMKRNHKFFDGYLRENGPEFYAGVDGMRELKKLRKILFNSKINYSMGFNPFHDESETICHHLDGKLFEKIEAFCKERHVPTQSLLQLGIHTHLSKINEDSDDVNLMLTINRRSIVSDMNSGGSRALALPIRTVISKDTTFADALNQQSLCQMRVLKHCDYSSKKCAIESALINHRIPGTLTTSMLFTYLPKEFLNLPEGIDCRFGGVSTGHFVCVLYTMIVPSFEDGGLDCFYEYQTYRLDPQDLENMHKNMIKVIEAGIENPNMTIGEILRSVL